MERKEMYMKILEDNEGMDKEVLVEKLIEVDDVFNSEWKDKETEYLEDIDDLKKELDILKEKYRKRFIDGYKSFKKDEKSEIEETEDLKYEDLFEEREDN